MSNEFSIAIEAGATYSLVITWNDSSGNPVNTTGYVGNCDVRDGSGSLIVNFNTTPTLGSITMGGSNGEVTLALSSTISRALPAGDYFYDLFVDSGTTVTKLLEGQCSIEGRVTQTIP